MSDESIPNPTPSDDDFKNTEAYRDIIREYMYDLKDITIKRERALNDARHAYAKELAQLKLFKEAKRDTDA